MDPLEWIGHSMSRISIVSGGFDPVHSGHINLMLAAKELGDELIVLLNSDKWLENKKGRPFIKGLVIRNSDQKYKSSETILPEKQT